MTTDEPLMTVKQVAMFFQVSEYTVRVWLNDHDVSLKGRKIGKSWRITTAEVQRFANERYGEG